MIPASQRARRSPRPDTFDILVLATRARSWGYVMGSSLLAALLLLHRVARANSASPVGACLTDYRVHQKAKPHFLSETQLESLGSMARLRNPGEGWRLLGEWGDPYAALAHQVVSGSAGMANQFYRRLIRSHWIHSVGREGYDRHFQPVAAQHFRQYVEILRAGHWPDSDQILLSYLTAVTDHGLPEVTVFDAAWVRSGYGRFKSWQDLNRLDEERTVRDSKVCLRIPESLARDIIKRDFLALRYGGGALAVGF